MRNQFSLIWSELNFEIALVKWKLVHQIFGLGVELKALGLTLLCPTKRELRHKTRCSSILRGVKEDVSCDQLVTASSSTNVDETCLSS